MAYTQHFGLSRNSPLNERQSIMQNADGTAVNVKKEAFEKKVNTLVDRSNIDTDPSKASTIINQNNNKSQVANAAIGGSKFFGEQLVGEGLKKYIGPMVSKVFGVASMMLSPTTAYGGSYDKTQHMERFIEENAGDPEKIANVKENFFNDQYKNFDSQTDFQKNRLKYLNQKYDLGYSQKDPQYFKDVKTDEM
jgi:hypothetical protein